jgi:hypothetical protein
MTISGGTARALYNDRWTIMAPAPIYLPFDFTDREIQGCCCGKASVSPRLFFVRW